MPEGATTDERIFDDEATRARAAGVDCDRRGDQNGGSTTALSGGCGIDSSAAGD
jgi:hypothetical protein